MKIAIKIACNVWLYNNHTSCSKRTFYLTKTTRSVAILTNDYFSNYLPFHITTSLLRLGKGIKRERGEGSSRGLAVRALGLLSYCSGVSNLVKDIGKPSSHNCFREVIERV